MTDSLAPKVPLSDTMNCEVVPSSLLTGPVTDQSAGPSGAPPTPCVSLIVVVTLADAGAMATAEPVLLA